MEISNKLSRIKIMRNYFYIKNLLYRVELPFIEIKLTIIVLEIPGTSLCVRDSDLTLVNVAKWLFLGHFWVLLKRVVFFEAAGAISKIGSGLKSKLQIKFSLPKYLIHTVWNFDNITEVKIVVHTLVFELWKFKKLIQKCLCQAFNARLRFRRFDRC